MDVIWHGHACFEVRGAGKTLVFDPHDGSAIGIKPPSCRADVVTVSHRCCGHSAVEFVKGNHINIVEEGGEFRFGNLELHGFRMSPDSECPVDSGGNTIYLAKAEGISLCRCGGLCKLPPEDVMKNLVGKVDVLFAPVGEFRTLDLKRLSVFIEKVGPTVVVPMMYRTGASTLPMNPLDDFLSTVDGDSVMRVGSRVELTKDDLPDMAGYWIFER